MSRLPVFLPGLLAAGALMGLAYVVGRCLSGRLAYRSGTEAAAVSTSLGLGVIGTAVFVVGVLGRLDRSTIGSMLALGFLACHRVWRAWPGCAVAAARRWNTRTGLAVLAGLALLAVVCAPFVGLALYPPVPSDATSFHLAMPKIQIAEGRVEITPFLRYPVFPLLNEMLFAVMLLFGGDGGAQLVQCGMMLLTGLLAYEWGRALASWHVGLWAAALWLGNPLVALFGTMAFIDVGLTLFVLAAGYSLFRWAGEGGNGWLLLAGAFSGFAAGSKYSALFFVGAFGLGTLYRGLRTRRWSAPVVFGLVALAVAAPWYVYNAAHTGNPVFPFFGRLFGYGPWNAADLNGQVNQMLSFGRGRSVVAFLRLPWHMASHPVAFHMEAALSPFYLVLLPPMLAVGALHRPVRPILALSLGYVVFWFSSVQVARYLFPVLPFLSLLAAVAVGRVARWIPVRLGFAAAGGLALVLAGVLLAPGWSFAVTRGRELGRIPRSAPARHQFLARSSPTYEAYRLLNERRGGRYRLYQLYDEGMAYFADGTFMGDWFGPARYSRIVGALADSRALHRELGALGADHFLIWANRYGSRERPPDDEFFRRHFKVLYAQGPITLFEIVE